MNLTVEQYKQWKQEGLTDRNILEKLYYSPNSRPWLTEWKRRNGLLPPRKKRAKNNVLGELTIKQFAWFKYKGLRHTDIAKELKVNDTTIDKWVQEQKEIGNIPQRKMFKQDWLLYM